MNNRINDRYALFTISDANYVALALTMFESVSKFYQDSDLYLFIVGTGTAKKSGREMDGLLKLIIFVLN
jgi:hypothetical protein